MFLLMIGVLRFAVFSSSFVGADIVYLSCVFRSITFSANFCKENRTSFQQTASSAACFSALIYAFFRPHQHFATFSVDAALFFIYIFSVDVINIPRRSRGYFICGRSPILLAARVTSRWYGLAAAKGLLLATRKRVF